MHYVNGYIYIALHYRFAQPPQNPASSRSGAYVAWLDILDALMAANTCGTAQVQKQPVPHAHATMPHLHAAPHSGPTRQLPAAQSPPAPVLDPAGPP
jgi:hypothetical protein